MPNPLALQPSPNQRGDGKVYLLHFRQPYHHAQHYIGFTTGDIQKRLDAHVKGNGAALMNAVTDANIPFTVARTWNKVNRYWERSLKNRHNTPKICPVCRGENYPQ